MTLSIPALGISQVVADSGGSFSATIYIPSTAPVGTYTLTGTESGSGRTAYATIYVSSSSATVSANPSSGLSGNAVAVTGTGFTAGETVTLGLATSAATSAYISGTTTTFAADGNGNFSQSYTVPSSQVAGSYLLLASGSSSGRLGSAAFTITGVGATATATATATNTPFPTATAGPGPVPDADRDGHACHRPSGHDLDRRNHHLFRRGLHGNCRHERQGNLHAEALPLQSRLGGLQRHDHLLRDQHEQHPYHGRRARYASPRAPRRSAP